MPKLSKKQAASVGEQEGAAEYTLIPDCMEQVRLRDVKVSDKEGPSGYHYWTWELEIVEGEFQNRRLWFTTSLSPQSEFVLKQAFDAFGYSTDSDTDEMLGDVCTAVIGHRVIEKGAKTGEKANTVEQLLPFGTSNDVAEEEPF